MKLQETSHRWSRRLMVPALLTAGGVLALSLVLLSGCRRPVTPAPKAEEEFHADNDIAMTVRSVSDAFSVKEALRGDDYNFEGVLTDGEGAPLYTDIMGSPGQWSVRVIDDRTINIRNLYLGDLLPENLRQYIASTLSLGEPVSYEVNGEESEAVELACYKIEGGEILFETKTAKAPNGVEGPQVNILLRATK